MADRTSIQRSTSTFNSPRGRKLHQRSYIHIPLPISLSKFRHPKSTNKRRPRPNIFKSTTSADTDDEERDPPHDDAPLPSRQVRSSRPSARERRRQRGRQGRRSRRRAHLERDDERAEGVISSFSTFRLSYCVCVCVCVCFSLGRFRETRVI